MTGLVSGLVLGALAVPTAAHSPHDEIFDVAVSPAFAEDGTAYTISRSLLLRTTDHGRTWQRLTRGLDFTTGYRLLAVADDDPSLVLVATAAQGLARSGDAGESWTPLRDGPSDVAAVVLGFDGLVVVATGSDDEVWRSTDAGDTWETVDTGLRAPVVAVGADGATVAAGAADGTVAISNDAGESWSALRGGADGQAVSAVHVRSTGAVVVGTESGSVYQAGTGDDGLEALPDPPGTGPVTAIADEPSAGVLWVVRGDEGPAWTQDDGVTWNAAVVGLTTDPQVDERAYADQFSFGRLAITSGSQPVLLLAGFDGLFRSDDLGTSWSEVPTLDDVIVGFDVSAAYADSPDLVVSTYVAGLHLSNDGGATWSPAAGLDAAAGAGSGVVRLFNVVMSPAFASDRTLFTSTDSAVLRSDDGGGAWTPLEPGDAPTSRGAPRIDIVAVSPAFATDGTVAVGTRDGLVVVSDDRGATFGQRTDLGGPVRSVVFSPDFASDGVVLASTSAGVDGSGAEVGAAVHRSADGGRTWSTVVVGRPGRLAVSPAFGLDSTVLLASRRGLFRSLDGGASFSNVGGDDGGLALNATVEAVAVSPAFPTDRTIVVSIRGEGLMRSVDGGDTFVPFADELIAANELAADFDKPTARPIRFSPAYTDDRTLFVSTVTDLFRSEDDGETWQSIAPPDLRVGRATAPGTVVIQRTGATVARWLLALAGVTGLVAVVGWWRGRQ